MKARLKMAFETVKRFLIVILISISFYTIVTGSEPPYRKVARNGIIRKAKSFSPIPKYLPESRIDLDMATRTRINTVLNSAGVFGLGVLLIKEISNALGTPILAPFLLPPLILVSTALLFFPQIRDIVQNLLKQF